VLTVFVATSDRASTLKRVLSSYTELIAPSGGWKLVLIHNGPDDGSAQVARSFSGRLPLVIVSAKRRGKNRALNRGLRELEGDLAVFSDDDCLPDSDWLVRLRAAADSRPEYAVFGGAIAPLWTREPEDWIVRSLPLGPGPTFALTNPAWDEGPCDPARVWGPNMAIRAEAFRKGFRFDEDRGPNGSETYAMGGETELTLRLAIAERLRCWHCADARVRHIVTPAMMTKRWILRRSFRLGRCLFRETRQRDAARDSRAYRPPAAIHRYLARNIAALMVSHTGNRWFGTRWHLCLGAGWAYEAVSARRKEP
jgi:glycosyltransferase involved in cell wall biosynthesis